MISYEEALSRLNRPFVSLYEQEHGITKTSDFREIANFGDIVFLEQSKSDGSTTLGILYQVGRGWFWMIPTHNQVKVLTSFLPERYAQVNFRNEQSRVVNQ